MSNPRKTFTPIKPVDNFFELLSRLSSKRVLGLFLVAAAVARA